MPTKRNHIKRSLVLLALAGAAFAQTPKPEFEVASIRVAVKDNSSGIGVHNERFETHNVTLKVLVARAFEVSTEEVFGGPDWADQDSYDIQAKMPVDLSDSQKKEQRPLMLQALLADRFHLVMHRETRQVSGYTLTVGKSGPKLETANAEAGTNMDSSRSQLKAQNADMDGLTKFLADRLEAPVANKTGLTGGFNFKLRWSPDALAAKADAAADAPPILPTAVQEQLGLKLDSGKISVAVIVIDSAAKPNAN